MDNKNQRSDFQKFPSIDLAFDWVKEVLAKQSSTVDSLDSKTATLFSIGTAIFGLGIGIPLSISNITLLDILAYPLGWLLSLTYAYIALSSIYCLWVREYDQMNNPIIIREDFWALSKEQFKTELLSHIEDAYEHNEAILLRKSRATMFIVPAVVLEALFLVVFLGFAF